MIATLVIAMTMPFVSALALSTPPSTASTASTASTHGIIGTAVSMHPAVPRTTNPPTFTFAGTTSTANRLTIGATYTQLTGNGWDPAQALDRSKAVLSHVPLQNQMLMGWGALNPEPSPGVFDFRSLDARLAVIRSTGATPVITLCCAPDWMKGGKAGAKTDWSRLTVAPYPASYKAFAQLAVATAKRYPDVGYFQVWNEMKGFFDPAKHRWNYEAYTAFYNTVYDALKAYNPKLQIGGPYVAMDSYIGSQPKPSLLHGSWGTIDQRDLDVVTYWLAHKHGADFVAVDGNTASRDAPPDADVFAGVDKLTTVTKWLRTQTSLPIWWSELYPFRWRLNTSPVADAAVSTYALAALADTGASVALLWQQDSTPNCVGPCLWTDTRLPNGGRLTPTGSAVLQLISLLRQGAQIQRVAQLPVGVVGYAVRGTVILINSEHKAAVVMSPSGAVSVPARGAVFTPAT